MKENRVKVDHSELLRHLTDGITELVTSDKWNEYLAFQARFHNYSAGNVQLIAMQSGGYATQVAGFNTWKAQGRNVKKGEKGLFILAPLAFKSTDKETGEETFGVKGFRYVAVFDVAQTEGLELPEISSKITGEAPEGVFIRLIDYARELGFMVTDFDFENTGVNGDCNHETKLIRVEVSNSPAQRVKTLAHELSHAILHTPETTDYRKDRALCELEAESSAYVICQALGVDSSDYSFGYVAGWAGAESAVKGIKASQDRIHKASSQVLKSFESTRELVAA